MFLSIWLDFLWNNCWIFEVWESGRSPFYLSLIEFLLILMSNWDHCASFWNLSLKCKQKHVGRSCKNCVLSAEKFWFNARKGYRRLESNLKSLLDLWATLPSVNYFKSWGKNQKIKYKNLQILSTSSFFSFLSIFERSNDSRDSNTKFSNTFWALKTD